MTSTLFHLTPEQLRALPELAELFPEGCLCDSFANRPGPGPLMAMVVNGDEVLVHVDGRIVTSQGQQIRPRMAAA